MHKVRRSMNSLPRVRPHHHGAKSAPQAANGNRNRSGFIQHRSCALNAVSICFIGSLMTRQDLIGEDGKARPQGWPGSNRSQEGGCAHERKASISEPCTHHPPNPEPLRKKPEQTLMAAFSTYRSYQLCSLSVRPPHVLHSAESPQGMRGDKQGQLTYIIHKY